MRFDDTFHQVLDELAAPAETQRADWNDVLARTRGADVARSRYPRSDSSRARRLATALALIVVGSIAGALTTAFAMTESASGEAADTTDLSTVSTLGHPVPLSERSARRLALLTERESGRATRDLRLMAQRGDTAFFRVPLFGGRACFLRGTLSPDGKAEIGSGICGWKPTPFRPILDLSPVEADGPEGFRVLGIEGFAADGVKTIEVLDESEGAVAEVAVHDNVYKVTAYAPSRVSALRFLDGAGNVVHRYSHAPSGGSRD